jgi:hypothetical protein
MRLEGVPTRSTVVDVLPAGKNVRAAHRVEQRGPACVEPSGGASEAQRHLDYVCAVETKRSLGCDPEPPY